jgi:hypothetical protein
MRETSAPRELCIIIADAEAIAPIIDIVKSPN